MNKCMHSANEFLLTQPTFDLFFPVIIKSLRAAIALLDLYDFKRLVAYFCF